MSVRTDTGPFAMVPEWLLYSGASGNAVKLFAILHRHEGPGGIFPSRKRLSELMDTSTDTVDRAVSELCELGAVTKERRQTDSGEYQTSAYTLSFLRPPSRTDAVTPSRESAATPSRTDAALTKALFNENPLNESSGCARAPARDDPPEPVALLDQRSREVLGGIRVKLGERVWYDSPDIEAEFVAFLGAHGPSAVEDAVLNCYRANQRPFPSNVRRYLPQEESLDRTPYAGRPRIATSSRQPGDFSRPAGRDETYDLHRIAALHAKIPIGTATA